MLTIKIKVVMSGSTEEIAFDDIKVLGFGSPDPEPDNHPASFMATVTGSWVDLSWTDATGTNLPAKYVIYASTTNPLPFPVDGTPPTIDTDLSDGDAVITVNHGGSSSYTFRSLTGTTTYYFQIWAYSSNIDIFTDYLTSTVGPAASVIVSEPVILLEEDFETDGHPSRYTASSDGGFHSDTRDSHHKFNAYFKRTNGSDVSIYSMYFALREYTGFSGSWFWAAEDTDSPVGNGHEEQAIVFKKLSIAGYPTLSISGLFGAGNEERHNSSFYDADDYIRVSYQIDSKPEKDVLCFSYEDRGRLINTMIGLDADCDGRADNTDGTDRLSSRLAAYSANILETGDSLTVRVKVSANLSEEELAFDDIKVSGFGPPNPEPDNHPTAFMAIARGSQIDLSWTDATGTDLPAGYVIYANTTDMFSVPADGTPPPTSSDPDLSDGSAVVIVHHGADSSSYTFTGLTPSTTYYFQIWAYSNLGSHIDYLTSAPGPTASSTIVESFVLLEEGFETEGHPERYTASSGGGFYGYVDAHFRRTDGSDISNVSGAYTGFSGTNFWAAEDVKHHGGDGNVEQTIVFNRLSIAGLTELLVSGLFGSGNENPRGSSFYEASDYIRLTYQIDSKPETDILCFRTEIISGDQADQNPLGLDADCSGLADNTNGTNRLGTALATYSANIPETGDSLTIRIKVRVDSRGEEIAFDDIKVVGLSDPQPDNHPVAFTATASDPTQIDLSWTDATGIYLPAGYVIYANTTDVFSFPTLFSLPADGIPPIIDTDLSDGSAAVTVDHGAGTGYTFTSLTPSTTYYFQIWAYGNESSRINYLNSPLGPVASATVFEPTVIFEEGFETAGHPSRYTASSSGGFYANADAYFHRTDGSDIDVFSGAYTGFSDTYFWAAEDTDDNDGDRNREQTIVFNRLNIAGYTGLSISGLFGGNGRFGADDYIQVSYQIDSGVETDVLCFGVENQDISLDDPLGLDADCDGTADNTDGTDRLGTELVAYRADVPETGDFLTVEIKVNADRSRKEVAFDDIKVSGFSSPRPEPDNHPIAFTAIASGLDQIDLSWTDAEGTNVPAGYVIHANTDNEFTAPTDGIPPIIDADLSDGSAVVTVDHGAGYTFFTSLAPSTIYYFQIWAYSNRGSNIDYLTSTPGSTASATTSDSEIIDVILLKERFETDGHPHRYVASSDGGFFKTRLHSHFARTTGYLGNVPGPYTGFSGAWYWSAKNTDGGGDYRDKQTIVF